MKKTRTEGQQALAWLLFIAALLVPTPSSAQTAAERAEARAHFDRGLSLAKSGDYDAALREFQRAYEVVPHYGVLYNIAQAQVAAGQSAEARQTFQRYLTEGGSAVEASRRAEVEAQLAKLHERSSEPGRAPTATAPEPTAPEPPQPAKPSAPPPSAPPPARPPATARDREAASPTSGAQQPRDSGSSRRTVAYVLGGAGAVLAGATLGHYLWNRSRYEDWKTHRRAYERRPSEYHRATTNDLAESISRASVVTVALCVGASVTLGSGVVLFVSSRPSPAQRGQVVDGVVGVRGAF